LKNAETNALHKGGSTMHRADQIRTVHANIQLKEDQSSIRPTRFYASGKNDVTKKDTWTSCVKQKDNFYFYNSIG
jgi:hypothetical protein